MHCNRGPISIVDFSECPGMSASEHSNFSRGVRGRISRHRQLSDRLRRFWSPARHQQNLLEKIRQQHAELRQRSTAGLLSAAEQLEQQCQHGHFAADEMTVSAFALMTEAVIRATGKEYYDVQLRGGLCLVAGGIAEMHTGEGKTLTTGLPAFALSLHGKGVHVATTNAYLAGRDSEELRPALELLGLTVGVLPEEHDPAAARRSYQCDVTFGTGYDFGFDFLRDQISLRKQPQLPLGGLHLARLAGRRPHSPELLQRPHAFAIVDEADSVLIDEATMPLILSMPVNDKRAPELLSLAAKTAGELVIDDHYVVNESERLIEFTDSGWQKLHQPLESARIAGLKRPWNSYVEQALRAQLFLRKDVEYVVVDGEVHIVDQQTGRIHAERSWRDGLHQAVESKEGLLPSPEKSSEGRVSRQRYFQLYDQLCGMTGTAAGSGSEFEKFYGLPVTNIPTHRPCLRITHPVRCFANDDARETAVVQDTIQRWKNGQPVLIGTRTILRSERLATKLRQAAVPHAILNGVQDEAEADIIGRAGIAGTITIATNMAGRGTDIKPDAAAIANGGLHVLAVEHNSSPRVDRQLAGRAARQGQPGSVQFFVSAEDELFVQGSSNLPAVIRANQNDFGEHPRDLAADIERLQQTLERKTFSQRLEMVQRDKWLDSVLESLASQGEQKHVG